MISLKSRLMASCLAGSLLLGLQLGAVAAAGLVPDTSPSAGRLAPVALPVAPSARQAARVIGEMAVASPATLDPAVPVPDEVDLAALYYYAKQGEIRRVDAETRRLQAKYPGFTAPDDLYAPQAGERVDESQLWRLYEADDFAAIEAEIEQMRHLHPGWQPSEDFSGKLVRREQRHTMQTAVENRDWAGVIAAGRSLDPAAETEIDLMWMLIDATRETGSRAELVALYQAILFGADATRFADAAIVATLEKAMADFSVVDVRAAMSRFAFAPSSAQDLERLEGSLIRREIAEAVSPDGSIATLAADKVARLQDIAGFSSADDLSLLGWYHLKSGKPAEADAWFTRALSVSPDIGNVKGLYLSLVGENKPAEADQLLRAELPRLADDSTFLLSALAPHFTDPSSSHADAELAGAYATAIQQGQSAEHAEILGWYAYNSAQFDASVAWFAKSWGWKNTEASLRGLALSYLQVGAKSRLASLRDDYEARFPAAFADLKAASSKPRKNVSMVEAPSGSVSAQYQVDFRNKRYAACLAGIRSIEATRTLPAEAQLTKGWCLLELDQAVEARVAFAAALKGDGSSQGDAAYGMGLALLRSRLADDAEALLARYPVGTERKQELLGEVYWQRASDSFARKDYQRTLDALNARLQLKPESAGISRMRAWSHYHLGHLKEAEAIFTRLNMMLSDKANTQGLAAIANAQESR